MFEKYSTDTLLKIHANLEAGVTNAVDVFIAGGKKSGYAADSYFLTMEMLAGVEDELYARGAI